MDPHVRWLRRRVARSVVGTAVGWLAAASALALVVAVVLTDRSAVSLVPWAVLAGQVLVVIGLVRALLTNPLSFGYVQSQGDSPRRYRLAPSDMEPEVVRQLSAIGLTPLVPLRDDDIDEPLFDLFQNADQSVTVARRRGIGSVAAMSRLDDRRILFTDTVLPLPHRKLVCNPASGVAADDVAGVLAAHEARLARTGAATVADDGFAFIEALAAEHDALIAIGPVFAPFIDQGVATLTTRFTGAVRFLTPIDLTDLPAVEPGRPLARV